jgi:actin-related protein
LKYFLKNENKILSNQITMIPTPSKVKVVLDNGAGNIKVGFSTDKSPKFHKN